jgi:hypothetical protein
MPHRDPERRKQTNRAWRTKQREGQCEAVTRRGARCRWVGSYDGYSGKILCGVHAR